uniref:UHRF1-binding protein 1-like n=1 Tax=Phallusia mammillata TaxID=59560 RepID=A0A6F9DWJ1_9ASCI|nr:UHRF1-binding protein 1-like [Phallusia mammillata]
MLGHEFHQTKKELENDLNLELLKRYRKRLYLKVLVKSLCDATMAGLIKKQILKHLSKFAKNLSADSIQLSTLRGEGELSNLELDCVAIQNLINLPTWLQINHAKCNKVHVKIPWTKLKGTAITIFLDAVELDMVTCEKPRPPNGPSPIEASASSGDLSYGFIQKVLEGIALRINSISVNFSSAVFKAEFQLSQLLVYSTDPDGKQADLRFTRILNKECGQVLTFKKVTWQTMRIAVDSATSSVGSGLTTPIRLITNQAQIKIVLRRKVSDLSVLASQLHIQFDDLLWVLTDAQVQSALLCVKSIRETIERSQQQSKQDRAASAPQANVPNSPVSITTPDNLLTSPSTNQYFNQHLILETSLHVDIDRIDLHICDDGSDNTEATYKKVVEGGAILITLYSVQVDHYPNHQAGKSRKHFRQYSEIASSRDKWAEENINKFRKDFVELKKAAMATGQLGSGQNSKLQESCFIVRLGDLEVGQVSSSSDKERSNDKIISSQRKELLLPDDMPLGCAIVTDYFFPDGRDYPAPHNNIFLRVNAPLVRAHWPSLLWCNQLALSTIRSVQKMLEDLGIIITSDDQQEEDHVDIRIETLMPKIFIPSAMNKDDLNTPEGIEIQISQATVTNCRNGNNCSRKSLTKLLETIEASFIASNPSSFPHEVGHDLDFLHKCFQGHAKGDDIPVKLAVDSACPRLTSAALKRKALHDVWSVWLRQVWVDFIMKSPPSNKNENNSPSKQPRTLPFIDSLPISMWISKNSDFVTKTNSEDTNITSSPKHSEILLNSDPLQADEYDVITIESHDHVIAYDQGRKPQKSSRVKPAASLIANSLPQSPTSTSSLSSSDVSQQVDDDSAESEDRKCRRKNKKLLEFYRGTIEESPIEPIPPTACTAMNGPASTYILVDTDSPLRIMLDHYQFQFLLRLAESIQGIGEKVYNDTDAIFSDKSSSSGTLNTSTFSPLQQTPGAPAMSSGVRVQLPDASIYLVLEPSLDGDVETVSESESQQSAVSPPSPITSNPLMSPTIQPLTPAPSECSSSDTVSILGDDTSLMGFPVGRYPSEDNVVPNSVPTERASLPPSPTYGRKRGNTDPAKAIRRKADDRLLTRFKDLNGSPLTSSTSCENVSTSKSSTMTSSGYDTASFDSSINSFVSSQEDECTSITSSNSSDNQFVLLEFDPPNPKPPTTKPESNNNSSMKSVLQSLVVDEPTNMADSQITVVEENGADFSSSEQSLSPVHQGVQVPEDVKVKLGSEKVSVLQIAANSRVELCVDACGDNVSVKVVAHRVALNELGNLTRDGAAALLSTPGKINHSDVPSFPAVRMRIDSGPNASRFSQAAVSTGNLQLHVDHLREGVKASSLANIGAFLEDDVVPEVMPMKIEANDIHLSISDDAEPKYATSAKLPPVLLHVQHASVKRSDDGTFHVSSDTSQDALINTVKDINTSVSVPKNKDPPISESTQTQSEIILPSTSCLMAPEVTNIGALPNGDVSHALLTNGPLLDHNHGEFDKITGKKDQEISDLQLKLVEMTKERDSLIAALQMMQDDLFQSEADRKTLRNQLKNAIR